MKRLKLIGIFAFFAFLGAGIQQRSHLIRIATGSRRCHFIASWKDDNIWPVEASGSFQSQHGIVTPLLENQRCLFIWQLDFDAGCQRLVG